MARALLLYGGSRRYHDGGVDVVPIEDFFANALSFLPIPADK
jgi:hypothetical protein